MFGKRGDGYLVKNIDPIIALMPYLMPTRNDAQVMMTYKIDYERMARWPKRAGTATGLRSWSCSSPPMCGRFPSCRN